MTKLVFLLSVVAILSACHPFRSQSTEIKIEPVTQAETQKILFQLQAGHPILGKLDSVESSDDACKNFQSTLPSYFIQGFVTVPENYDQPEGRKIQVFYYGRLEKNKAPVAFYNGGPASDSHGSSRLLERLPQAQQQSFIYIDQRGTGCSAQFPQSPATVENVERLTHYTSLEIVKDSEVIREKLLGPGSQWKVFGQSYGGLIVHRYSMVAPQSIKGAFAHGFSVMKDQNEWLKLRVKSQKRVFAMYLKEYPNDEAKLLKIRSLISETLCFNDGETKVCGPKVMDALTIYLGFSNYWKYLNQTLESILPSSNQNEKLDMSALHDFVRNYVFGVYNNNGLAGSVISQVEMSNEGSNDADSCVLANQKLAAEGENPQEWLINECRLLSGMQNNQWADVLKTVHTHRTMTPEQLKKTLTENPNLPFFLYAGEKDVFVPVETFQEEIAQLGNLIRYQQFPKSGHEGFYTEHAVWTDILAQ